MFLYISDTKPIKFGFFQGFLAKIIKHIFVHTYTLIYIHTHTYTDIHIQTYFSWGLERQWKQVETALVLLFVCQFCCICLRGPAPQTPLCTYAYTCKSTFTCTYSTTYTHRCIHAHMLLFIHTYTMLQHRPNIAPTWGLLP